MVALVLGLGLLSSVLTSSFAMDSKPLLMRRGADGDLHCTSAANKMKDAPASRGHMRCLTLLVQLTLWLLCRSTAYACVGCLRNTLASQVVLDPSHSGSWRDTRGRASRISWQPSTLNVPVWPDQMLAGWSFPAYCTTGCIHCSSCHGGLQPMPLVKLLPCLPPCSDRLKLRPLAKQMFSSSMLSELQLNRTTATSNCASASTCLPERKDALPTSATSNWSYALGHRLASMWIWRPWTEGLERWKHSYNNSCSELQAPFGTRWNNSSGWCAYPIGFSRYRFFCDAALLSPARPNVVSIPAWDASSCTQLKPCAKPSSYPTSRWRMLHSKMRSLGRHWLRSAQFFPCIRLWLHLELGVDRCALLPRLEESSPGAYLWASVLVPVTASCYPAPRLEVSSPGARLSAALVTYCHWLPTLCCRLEVSSPVTQWYASFLGIASDDSACRSWYLPPGGVLNHSCSRTWATTDTCAQTLHYSLSLVDLMLRESNAQWRCGSIFQFAPLFLLQPGLISVPISSSSGWTFKLLLASPLELCRNGLWMLERLGLPRGRAFFHRLWPALRTKRPPLSRKRTLWESQGPSSRLLWLRRVCRRPRRRRCILAVTAAPWKLFQRRPLRSQPQWDRDPGRTWRLCDQVHRLRRLLRLPVTSCPRLVHPTASTYLCLDHELPPCRPFPGGTRSRYRWTQCCPKHLRGPRHRHNVDIHWHYRLGWTWLTRSVFMTPVGCSEKDALPPVSARPWLTLLCSACPAPHCSLLTRLGSSVADGYPSPSVAWVQLGSTRACSSEIFHTLQCVGSSFFR